MTGLPAVLVDLPAPDEPGRLAALAGRLGYAFSRPALLRVALTLPSWTNEHGGWPHHQCLEFLGDAVLDLVTADALWRRFPALAEGALTRLQAAVVRESSLAAGARALGLGEFVYAGRGDREVPVAQLADTAEAVIAAAFLDARAAGGDPLAAAGTVIAALLGPQLAALGPEDGVDVKTELQRRIQAEFRCLPVYVRVGEPTPGHPPAWRVEVRLPLAAGEVRVLGEGTGRNVRAAEQAAATAALRGLESDSSET
jgi:ribonuclease-3